MSGSTYSVYIVTKPFGTYATGNVVPAASLGAAVIVANRGSLAGPIQVSGTGGAISTGGGTTSTTPTVTGGTGITTTGTSTGTGAGLTAAQLAAIANEPTDAAALATQAGQIASLQAALAGGSSAAVTTGTLVAAGTSQTTAAGLPSTINVVTSVPTGAGVILPAGGQCVVENKDSANPLLVYPPPGAAIGSAATNAPVQIVPGGTAVFSALNATQWFPE